MNREQIIDRIDAISQGRLVVADPGDELEYLQRKLECDEDAQADWLDRIRDDEGAYELPMQTGEDELEYADES